MIICAIMFIGNGVKYTWQKTMRRVQETLSNDEELNSSEPDSSSSAAALALKQKRLTFTWLDGEAQLVSFTLHFLFS